MQETEANDAVVPSEVVLRLLLGISGSFFDNEDDFFFFSFSKMRIVTLCDCEVVCFVLFFNA